MKNYLGHVSTSELVEEITRRENVPDYTWNPETSQFEKVKFYPAEDDRSIFEMLEDIMRLGDEIKKDKMQ